MNIDIKAMQKQYLLNVIDSSNKIYVDGIYGQNSKKKAVEVTGEQDPSEELLIQRIKSKNLYPEFIRSQFTVFVDAGHGGINDYDRYMTAGKRAYHSGSTLHSNGNYYEGHENRIIAEGFIRVATSMGINCIRTYHPIQDTPLKDRIELVESFLQRGHYGYIHSFHSNAISEDNTDEKLLKTQGAIVFTSNNKDFSDIIANTHIANLNEQFADRSWWIRKRNDEDFERDYEANFTIIKPTILTKHYLYGGILEEFGFHTSRFDAEYITLSDTRNKRILAAIATARNIKTSFEIKI